MHVSLIPALHLQFMKKLHYHYYLDRTTLRTVGDLVLCPCE